jgi:nucleoside 2-deoxyribosyltransferase
VKIYFAGPLFTPYERGFIDECATQLRAAGFDVFVPHEHELALDGTVTAERIFAKDWAALSEANAVLAILDGPMIDDGTACEIGIFYGLMGGDPQKRGIVGVVTDLRATRDSDRENEARGLNLFVVGCIEAAGTICTSFDEAVRALESLRAASVRFPEMRTELIETVRDLADEDHQRRLWRSGAVINPEVIDSVFVAADFMFDHADLLRNSSSQIGWILKDPAEAEALDALMEALEAATASVDDKDWLDPAAVDAILGSAHWPEVVANARTALGVLERR